MFCLVLVFVCSVLVCLFCFDFYLNFLLGGTAVVRGGYGGPGSEQK